MIDRRAKVAPLERGVRLGIQGIALVPDFVRTPSLMCAAASDAAGDALSRLRIQREAARPHRFLSGRSFRFLVALCCLVAVLAGSVSADCHGCIVGFNGAFVGDLEIP